MKLRIVLLAAAAAVSLSACKSKESSDNPDVAASYRGVDHNQYEADIVTAKKREKHADQGASIQPKTLQAIEYTISNVYEKDFERCLEREMDTFKTRFLRSVFTVEFTIDTSGQASQAKILSIQTRKQDAKGSDLGEVASDGMVSCVQDSIAEWVFEPPPEVVYKHTYRGQVGEAF